MKIIQLDHKLSLSFQSQDKKVRLVLSDDTEELVCRKEKIKILNQFLTDGAQNLFKGRLQLEKNNDNILILLKGNPIGMLSIKQFNEALDSSLHSE